MDTQQLKTFQKVAKELSFKRASKELGISQPTVTMRIKMLEEELGEALIIRTGPKAVLTPIGVVYLKYVDRAMNVFQSGVDRVLSEQGHHLITIASTSALNTFVLPKKLQDFKEKYPKVQFRIYTGTSDKILQMIYDEIIDIGIIRGDSDSNIVKSYPLFKDELKLVVYKHHPLLKKENVYFQDLKNESVLIYKRNTKTWKFIEKRFKEAGIEPKVIMELEHAIAVKQMVLIGAGIAFLPKITIEEELERGDLKILNLEGSPINRGASIVTPNRKLSQTVLTFLHFLNEEFKGQ